MVDVHCVIQKVNGPTKLCENKIKEIVAHTNVALDVVLIPIVLVRIKHVGSQSATPGIVVCNTTTLAPDVKEIIILEEVVL